MRVLHAPYLFAIIAMGSISVCAASVGAATGKSEMRVGFAQPETKPEGQKPWTRRQINAAHGQRYRDQPRLPRCAQDRLLTDDHLCDNSSHSQ